MRINHNITAMNSYRNFSSNTSKVSKNLEKVSTGMRINRAGDDAAGLAISEKMRAQISGIEGATKNAKDGISLIQTAEGALTEVHDMLNRMTTLAEQSANGTYDNKVDRNQLQKEVDALKSEIDRIADSTNYNGIKLLDGSLSGKGNLKGNVSTEKIQATVGQFQSTALNNVASLNNDDKLTYTVSYKDKDGNAKSAKIEFTVGNSNAGTAASALIGKDGVKYELGTAQTAALTELQNAIVNELNRNDELNKLFIAKEGTTTSMSAAPEGGTSAANTIQLDALEAGSAGAVVTGFELQKTTAAGATTTISTGSNVLGTKNATDEQTKLVLKNIKVLNSADKDDTDGTIKNNTFEVDGHKFVLYAGGEGAKLNAVNDFIEKVGSDVTVIQLDTEASNKAGGFTYKANNADATVIAGELKRITGMDFGVNGDDVVLNGDNKLTTAAGKSLDLQIGDTADSFNTLSVNVEDMHSDSIGIGDVDISTQEGAAKALDQIKDAVNFVSNTRGTLGALQNRLDHTINNLGVMKENITSSESLIRDTDVAEEMMNYTKNNILNQSAQAMLAQANQLPQGVLQLLG